MVRDKIRAIRTTGTTVTSRRSLCVCLHSCTEIHTQTTTDTGQQTYRSSADSVWFEEIGKAHLHVLLFIFTRVDKVLGSLYFQSVQQMLSLLLLQLFLLVLCEIHAYHRTVCVCWRFGCYVIPALWCVFRLDFIWWGIVQSHTFFGSCVWKRQEKCVDYLVQILNCIICKNKTKINGGKRKKKRGKKGKESKSQY